MKEYTEPKLCTCKDDITKDWYVYFSYQKKQFRYKLGINYLKTKKEREQEAQYIIKALLLKLENGWNPATGETDKELNNNPTLIEAFDEILSIKRPYITAQSYKGYTVNTSIFKKWLKLKNLEHIYVRNFTPVMARQYLDYLLTEKKYCGKTYNVRLCITRVFFNCMVDRKYISVSPFAGLHSVREDSGKNIVYSIEEERKLDEYMRSNCFNFYLATRLVRYCFLRPSELSKLQVKHILMDNKTIVVPSENSKSRVQDSVTIPKKIELLIEKSGILQCDRDAFVFGNSKNKMFLPGNAKLKRVDYFSEKQRSINDELDINPQCTFYSWKHSGVVELYNITKDPYTVMRQCRHSDVKTTMIYLRSLGCGVNEQVREW